MEKRELTCIGCPLGCSITVTLENGEGLAADHEREIGRLFGSMSEADLDALTEILKRRGRS